jgi:uncharacterized protein (DUF1684 family)
MIKNFGMLILFILFTCCKGEKRYHDENKLMYLAISDSTKVLQEVLEFQQNMNEEFKDPKTSPLTDRQRKVFKGLKFFEPDSIYRVTAKLVRTPDALPFSMPTTTSLTISYRKYGVVEFRLKDSLYKLNVYQDQQLKMDADYNNHLFLPFSDKTNGSQTYSGGRYIDLSVPEGDSIIVDFNRAYNPYCAYNKKYSCPLVPSENTLNIEIPVGVKAFRK